MNVQRGEISTIEERPADANGNPTRARVLSEHSGGVVTKPLVIPHALRGGALSKGTRVIFVEFSDRSGAILMRADGETSD